MHHPRVALDRARYSDRVGKFAGSASYFLPNGKAPVTGQRMTNPALAATLRAIAMGGRDAFYKGAVAEESVRLLRSLGGLHEENDFANFAAFETAPISAKYRGCDVLNARRTARGLPH